MNKKTKNMLLPVVALFLAPAGNVLAQAARNITWRLSEQKSVVTPGQILDKQFIPIGDQEPEGVIIEDRKNTYKGHTVYRFEATAKVNRIELSTAFGSTENLKGYTPQQVKELTSIYDGYINSDHGDYGDKVIYDWYTRFPKALTEKSGGIITQIHGRPDRTLVTGPDGRQMKLTISQMAAMMDTVYFEQQVGYSKATKKPNGWTTDAAAGGPITEMNIRPPYFYMMVRSSAERLSDPVTRTRPVPGRVKAGEVIGTNGKTGFLAFSMPSNDIPINEWIHFRMEVRYTKYNPDGDGVLKTGALKLTMNDKVLCDYKDVNIGKNDRLGPYFKLGIYKPGADGLTVEHSGFTETIVKQ